MTFTVVQFLGCAETFDCTITSMTGTVLWTPDIEKLSIEYCEVLGHLKKCSKAALI